MTVWHTVAQQISAATGETFNIDAERSVGGGCINAATVLEGGGRRYFVKLNDAALVDMFDAEAAGLAELARADAVRVPQPICTGADGRQSFIVMEYIPLGGRGGLDVFGGQFAKLHRYTGDRYGWSRDNTIGSTPQINTPTEDWAAFWQQQRLGFQLRLAAQKGYGGRLQSRGEQLLGRVGDFFTDYTPAASLLHGDLWSGNYAADDAGNPVIFDPAVYYGDREADLAMTELFGGFGAAFYRAYDEAYPLDPGYAVRKTLYNLYHIINHLNLFGGGYKSQAEGMIDRLLSELR